MLTLLEWRPDEPLYDPMCGSGTIPIEAALWASGRSPRLWERYACHAWATFDREVWRRELEALSAPSASVFHPSIFASDIDPEAIALTQSHLLAAQEMVNVTTLDLRKIERPPIDRPGLLLFNPPYGLRVREGLELKHLLQHIATHREEWLGWRVGFIYPRQLTPPQAVLADVCSC